ncbi:MAG: exosortase/archaeosortase family protein [Planctomycetaceae bacterium]|nr:exosortase/archaeosortase family protein [Planctomycetaceae bacterium]
MLPSPSAQIAWVAFAIVFAWFYWTSILQVLRIWTHNEDYQHGFVVPLFAIFLLWFRRDLFPKDTNHGNLWGLVLLAMAGMMRWAAVYFNFGSLPEYSIPVFLAGMALLAGGWQGLRWSWPSLVFLLFMIPLPGTVEELAREQLQKAATQLSVFVIQTLGIPAFAQGVVIQLQDRPLRVEEACSGLRMLSLFFGICVGAAFLVRRPLWEKLLIVASAPPIAIVSNVIRIVVTAIFYQFAGQWFPSLNLETAGETVHAWAGYLMMPIGLLLLLAELSLLSKLLIAPMQRPVVVGQFATGQNANTGLGVPIVSRKRRR